MTNTELRQRERVMVTKEQVDNAYVWATYAADIAADEAAKTANAWDAAETANAWDDADEAAEAADTAWAKYIELKEEFEKSK